MPRVILTISKNNIVILGPREIVTSVLEKINKLGLNIKVIYEGPCG